MEKQSPIAKLPGILLFAMMFLAVIAATSASISPAWASLPGWLAALLLFRRLPKAMVYQISGMLAIGITCIAWVRLNHLPVEFTRVISANIHVVALIASVTFLRLITQPNDRTSAALPKGKKALVKTTWGLHLFASVINLSAVMIFGNRMERAGKINRLQIILFSRAFCSGCYWSPFYVSIATALVYAPGSDFITLALAGIPIALAGLLITTWQLLRDDESDETHGYPLRFEALFIPLLLSTSVIALNKLFPNFPILTLITILAFLLTVSILVVRNASTSARLLTSHVFTDLPNMYRELMLFLAAGVMSTGISAVLTGSNMSLGITGITPIIGGGFILAAILFSVIGVHPIITISILGSLLSNTPYSANLLGICMMMMWGNGIVVSPFSGINLSLQGRFGVSSFSIMRWNAGYTFTMLIVCIMALYIYHHSNLV